MTFLREFITIGIITACAVSTAAAAEIGQSTIIFSDGAVATAFDHCGDTDLCATITYSNGDKLAIFSEGAAYCQPYMLHFVRTNGTTTIYEYSRAMNHDPETRGAFGIVSCGRTQTTQMVMDHGMVHLTVFENTDGTLRLVFSATGTS